jgi:hypothetical protein
MASDPVRIELRDVVEQREEAQRDLQETLEALEQKLLPQRVALRIVSKDSGLVLAGAAAAGIALGLSGSSRAAGKAVSLSAALAAGWVFYRLATDA